MKKRQIYHPEQCVRSTKRKKKTCMDDCFHLAVAVHLPPATGKGGFLDPNRFMAGSPAFQLAYPPNGMTGQKAVALRQDEYFTAQRQSIYRHTDSLFACLLILQWLAAIAISIWITPRACNGTASGIHPDAWAAVFLGGIICFIPLLLIWNGQASL
jgi:hypothetical protein